MSLDHDDHKFKIVNVGKFQGVMFPEGVIALNKELATGLHNALATKLANHPVGEVEVRLAEIAAHCSVVLDGVYGPEQISELCAILAGRLELLREVAPPQTILQ